MFHDGNHQQKGGNQPQQVDGKNKRLMWSHKMKLHMCLKLMHVLFKHIPLHEQRPLTSEWRRWKTRVISSNESIDVLRTNARIAQAYSLTWAKACVWCSHANKSGIGFGDNSTHLR
jgi:hypothetical protein